MNKIIVIESDELLRTFITEKLRNFNFEVIPCKDGFEGIIKIKNEVPDLIIMNLILDRMNALQVLKEKGEYKTTTSIPVILISGNMDKDAMDKLSKYKITRIMSKPIKLDTLVLNINEILKLKIELDKTQSLVDIHLNDDVLFIEVSTGLNKEKIEILKYKIAQIRANYAKNIMKVLVIFTNIQDSPDNLLKLNLLFEIIQNSTEASNSGIKILTTSNAVITNMPKTDFSGIEVTDDFGKAIDTFGKIDAFAYGDEIEDIKTDFLNTHHAAADEHVELSFAHEKIQMKAMLRDKHSIAIVDDDLYILEYMATVLEREEWTIYTYESAKVFLSDMWINKPDLIFLDLMMPEMNGFQLVKVLQERNIFIPTVIVTALSQKEMVLKAREFGITNFLTKPLSSDKLIAKAEELLNMPIM